ncbi:MAG: hypothetical protein K2F98_10035, partial [Bacteroides sp.]|nr:hypothetical protein [Bacteroides sp.]
SHFPIYVNESYKGIHMALGTFLFGKTRTLIQRKFDITLSAWFPLPSGRRSGEGRGGRRNKAILISL